MNSPPILVRFLIALGLLFASHGLAQADAPHDNQLLKVSCDPTSQVHIRYVDPADGNDRHKTHYDIDGNSEVEFEVPNGVTSVKVTKISDGRALQYTVKLKGGTAGARSLRWSE